MEKICIESIRIEKFKGIRESTIVIPKYAPWIFLTGENGTGKTVFLQAIATALFPIEHQINDTKDDIGVGGFSIVSLYHSTRYGMGIKPDGTIDLMFRRNFSFLSCFGPSRLQTLRESDQNERVGPVSGISRLFRAHTFLKNIDFQLIKWELLKDSVQLNDKEKIRAQNRLQFTKELLIELLDLDDLKIDISKDEVLYFEKGTDDSKLDGVRSNHLGAGYRNLLGFIGDMILNLIGQQPLVEDPKELLGIVIVDELELHLHPSWQKALPGILSKYFPRIQFIASTHSAIPLLGAPEGSVFLKVDRTAEEGITIKRLEQLERDIKYLQPNAVFTSDIFDIDEIKSNQLEDISKIRSEDHFDDIGINDEVKERLKNLGDDNIFPKDLFKKD